MLRMRMFDARNGLSAQVVEDLRRAGHVVLALKDRQTAAWLLAA
jgi:hypothetical protein